MYQKSVQPLTILLIHHPDAPKCVAAFWVQVQAMGNSQTLRTNFNTVEPLNNGHIWAGLLFSVERLSLSRRWIASHTPQLCGCKVTLRGVIYKVCAHEINFHEISSHVINSYTTNFI